MQIHVTKTKFLNLILVLSVAVQISHSSLAFLLRSALPWAPRHNPRTSIHPSKQPSAPASVTVTDDARDRERGMAAPSPSSPSGSLFPTLSLSLPLPLLFVFVVVLHKVLPSPPSQACGCGRGKEIKAMCAVQIFFGKVELRNSDGEGENTQTQQNCDDFHAFP